MARLAIDRDFLDDYSKLPKPVQHSVKMAIDKFAEHVHAGLHLEKLTRCKDDRIRTIRVDQSWRGVVLAPETGDTYSLLRVMPHDKAIEYAASHRFTVNEALGVVEIRDEAALEQLQPALERAARATDARLLAHVSDADLTRLGIDENTRTIARLLTSDAHLDAMQRMIPEAQYNALYLLAGGLPVEEVWAEVAQYTASATPQDERFDTGNLVQAMERTPGRVVFVQGNDELGKILEHPFAAWRIFLHPAQRKIAYAPRYAGAAQVTGGAGTGKTVTALHRAAFLARRATEQLFPGESAESVLLTTFTRNLAESLQSQFELLVDDEELRRQVEIRHVDSLAHRVVEHARGAKPVVMTGKELDDLWAAALKEAGLGYVPSFLNREWEQVILAQDLRSEQAYLTASRAGQGTPLGKAQRRQVWALTHWVQAHLRALGRDTFTQLANEAARALRDGTVKLPYRHVIIDEAQDLHPAQWRLLRAIVPARADDMFIVGDAHQRIYDNHVSLARVGVNVRGRSRRLTVNYRTTQEILALAVPALGKASVTGLDDEADTLTGYRSPLHGRRPKVVAARTRDAEYEALVRHVTAWREAGLEPHAIGVAARSNWLVKEAAAALNAAGLRTVSLSAKSSRESVRVGTMHGMKGLEFQAVAVIGVSDGIVPAPSALTDAAEDPVAHAQDLQRERCLLFVALTRARDHLYISYSGAPSTFLR
ncbi:MAG TPA: UvrD-helicase domain-containing protein [Stellaceae bacterium]|nr:UvrD-helicase domain-containing protein [Stellaceae bacterium]